MNRKNYNDLDKFVKRLTERIEAASDIELQNVETKDLFESLLKFEIFVYEFVFDIWESERVCPHCSKGDVDEKK